MDDVNQQGMPARGVDEGRGQAPVDEALLGGIDRFAQGRSRQEDAQPGKKRELIK
jgi:hypothetical protein